MNKIENILEILECDYLTAEQYDYLKRYIRRMQKKAELGEHYKHLYSELKKQKDELETSYDILQKNNTTLAKEKEKAYKMADDFYKENQHLKKQKDDVVELINYYGITPEQNDNTILRHILKDILRMLGEIDD